MGIVCNIDRNSNMVYDSANISVYWGATMPDETEWLTLKDVYKELDRKVPIDSIRQWIQSGRLKAYRPGKAYLIKREDLERFLRESQTRPDDDKN